MLERWLGVELVDRRHGRGLTLTPTARRHAPELQGIVEKVYELRSHMRAHAQAEPKIRLTTQHTLMVSHLPTLLQFFRNRQPETGFRVRTGNLEECIAQLASGEADLLLCFEAEGEVQTNGAIAKERLSVGLERLMPVIARGGDGQPIFDPDNTGTLKLLNYPEESFLGRVVRRQCLPQLLKAYSIDTVCESAFAVGIKEMVLEGMGVAWLPHGLIERELSKGDLLSLQDELASPVLSIAVYRLRAGNDPALERMWSLLERETPQL